MISNITGLPTPSSSPHIPTRISPINLQLQECIILQHEKDTISAALNKHAAPRPCDCTTLAAAISRGASSEDLKNYLDSYPREQVQAVLQGLVEDKHPILYYAAEKNKASLVHTLLSYGADPEAIDSNGVPVLAYTIMRSRSTVVNCLEVVKTLLAHGAQPHVIPQDMWIDYIAVPSAIISSAAKHTAHSGHSTLWCKNGHRQILAEALHLSLRYFLYRASQIRPTLARGMQLAHAFHYLDLLRAPYEIVGQHFACRIVVEQVASHIGMNIQSPLVLTFAGLSGHGKTELATKLGTFLQLSITIIDCAQMSSEVGLFGSRAGYEGNHLGSQLNNHLAHNSGKRSVVFLDEFDKTDQEVRNSLLLVLDSGHYHDRRDNTAVDSSKTIWILATNLGAAQISRFYEDKMKGLSDEQKLCIPYKILTNSLKDTFRSEFGAPVAGRMCKVIAPFYPFDIGEQAVIVHKFLLELADQVRHDIDITAVNKRFPGHINLAIRSDGALCTHMALESYISELGARSLKSSVDDVRRLFFTTFVDTNDLVVEESNAGPLSRYAVQLQLIPGAGNEVVVQQDGVTEYFDGKTCASFDDMQVDNDDEELSIMMNKFRTSNGSGREV